jgi:hypothetical protein
VILQEIVNDRGAGTPEPLLSEPPTTLSSIFAASGRGAIPCIVSPFALEQLCLGCWELSALSGLLETRKQVSRSLWRMYA